MIAWRCYYGDGSTFDSTQGPPSDTPAQNLQVIVHVADPGIGAKTVTGDFYWFDRECWYGGDLFGLFDYLLRVSPSIVKFGRVLPRVDFQALLARAVTDPDFQKTAWDTTERR